MKLDNFLPVVGYEEYYLISDNGCVYSKINNKILKPYTDKDGYQIVGLFKGGRQKKCKIHRLVAEAFILNPNNYQQVNHKDENPANNCVDNLEWCDCSYNINYGSRNCRVSEAIKITQIKNVER